MRIKRIIAYGVTILSALAAMVILVESAEARPRPGPAKKIQTYQAPFVVVDSAPETALPALYAINLWNAHATTELLCAADNNGNCAQVTCPDPTHCLVLRMGDLGITGPDATLRMFGPKRGLIVVNRQGPLFRTDMGNNYTPWHRGALMMHWVGRYMGIPVNATDGCATTMSPQSWQCPPPRPGTVWLTPAEISQAAAW